MTIIIRPAGNEDFAGLFAVHEAAFPTPAEARLVTALIADGDALLSLVAERDGVIVGHVLFSRMTVSAGGNPLPAAALAPVAVLPALHGLGIGTSLIDHGLAQLDEDGIRLVFVLGEPDFYDRFGFDPAIGARFASPYAGDYWMGLALDDRPLPKRGEARHAPAFERLEGNA